MAFTHCDLMCFNNPWTFSVPPPPHIREQTRFPPCRFGPSHQPPEPFTQPRMYQTHVRPRWVVQVLRPPAPIRVGAQIDPVVAVIAEHPPNKTGEVVMVDISDPVSAAHRTPIAELLHELPSDTGVRLVGIEPCRPHNPPQPATVAPGNQSRLYRAANPLNQPCIRTASRSLLFFPLKTPLVHPRSVQRRVEVIAHHALVRVPQVVKAIVSRDR